MQLLSLLLPFLLQLSAPQQAPANDTSATDWPRFRGAEGTGVLAQRAFPETWDEANNLAWSVELPGAGWSSPVVVGDRVFVSTAVQEGGRAPASFREGVSDPMTRGGGGAKPTEEVAFQLHCLDLADGTTVWSRDAGKRVPDYPIHPSNTYATATPASDGERVFVTFGALGRVVAYGLEGEVLWSVDVGVGKTGNDFGWGISLVAADGMLFVQNDNEESSFLAALDAKTGEQRWRTERAKGTSWGTPVLRDGARPQLIACGSDTVIAYAPDTGEELWRLEGLGSSFSSSPTYDSERVYFGTSGPMSRGPLVAVSADAEGTLDLKSEDASPAWTADRAGPGFPSPVAHEGRVYVLGSPAILACHDAETGERLWRERLPDAGTLVASPWVAGDELFILDEAGRTFVTRPGAEFELLRVNELPGLFWSTPSVAGDALLLRSSERLYCVRATNR